MDTSTNSVTGTLTTPDGLVLYTKTWPTTSKPPSSRLVFIHGFSDHCNFYGDLFPLLAARGIEVHSFDQRGWGRSVHTPAQRGLTGPTSQVLDDITFFIEQLPPAPANVPLFLMGHSMGGGEVLMYAATGPAAVTAKIRGYLVESPFIALHPSARPWRPTVVLGRLAAHVLPHMQLPQKLDESKLCRDPEVCKAWSADPLNHDTGTLEGLAGLLDRAGQLESGKAVVKEGRCEGGATRLWVGHGTGDAICDFEAARKWYESTPVADKEMRVYEGWYHKLHSEPGNDKKQFADDVATWILARSGDIDTVGKPKL